MKDIGSEDFVPANALEVGPTHSRTNASPVGYKDCKGWN